VVIREGPSVPKRRSIPTPPSLPPVPIRDGWQAVGYAWTVCTCLTPVLIPMVLTILALFGLIRLGEAARADLSIRDRRGVSFDRLECPAPPGEDNEEFLSEVQYLSGWPDRLCLWDNDIATRLAGAFGRHPWVEQVERIVLAPDRSIRVHLRFRIPVLAVRYGGQLRAVDAHGILLPATAPTNGLPRFQGVAALPQGPAGTPWGDAAVTAAASQMALP
jgi:hypothetical protein